MYNYEYTLNQEFPKKDELICKSFKPYMYKYYYKTIIPDIVDINLNNISYIKNKDCIDIYTIFVNKNEYNKLKYDMIDEHIRLVHKYINNNICHTLVDVSDSDYEDMEELRNICKKYGSDYIYIPNLFSYNSDVNINISIVMNYVYNEYILKRNCKYFGFLNSNIYLTKNLNIVKILDKNHCCGRTYSFDIQHWHLCDSFNFYLTEKFDSLDFCLKEFYLYRDMKPPYYSIGGRNHYLYFYKYIRYASDITICTMEWKKLVESIGDINFNCMNEDEINKLNGGYVEIYNLYINFTNYYRKVSDYFKKMNIFLEFIKKY